MRAFLALCLAAVAGCAQASGDAPEPPEPRAAEFRSRTVQQAMDSAATLVRTRGFAGIGEEWRGFLVDHASDVRELPMRSGTCYVLLGAGSSAMRELNLRVFDSDGAEIVQDATNGPLAALHFCPSQSGTYYVAVHASAGSGLFEVRTFRGPTGLEVRIDDIFREVAPAETGEVR
ncbi:MAG TPA: hypothetical protein VIL20_26620 [Sandaracinaceae bacterium]